MKGCQARLALGPMETWSEIDSEDRDQELEWSRRDFGVPCQNGDHYGVGSVTEVTARGVKRQ